MKILTAIFVIGVCVLGDTAAAQNVDMQNMSPQQLTDYVGALFNDRLAFQLQIDRLRIEIEDAKRAIAAERATGIANAAEVDRYWRRWVGLEKPK